MAGESSAPRPVVGASVSDLLEKAVKSDERVRTFAYCERQVGAAEFVEAAAVLTNQRLMIVQSAAGEFWIEDEAPRGECRIINSKTRDDGSVLAALTLGPKKALLFFPESWATEADRLLVALQWGDYPDDGGAKSRPVDEPPLDTSRPAPESGIVDTVAIAQEFAGLAERSVEDEDA